MKKIIVLGLAMLLCVGFVFGKDVPVRVTNVADGGSVGPESPLYFLDVLFDDLSVTGTAQEKAVKRLKIADERLAELENAEENGEDISKPATEYNKQINNIKKEGGSVDEELSNRVLVLERVRDKLLAKGNANAAEAITNALSRTMEAKTDDESNDESSNVVVGPSKFIDRDVSAQRNLAQRNGGVVSGATEPGLQNSVTVEPISRRLKYPESGEGGVDTSQAVVGDIFVSSGAQGFNQRN